jgi:hypothetical protein
VKRIVAVIVLASVCLPASADPQQPADPFMQDPLGPIVDVTMNAADYQPAERFCIKPDVFDFTEIGSTHEAATGATFTGADPDCAFSGFAPADTGLYKIDLGAINRQAPALCGPCRRLFIDFSKIPANDPPYYYAHGHAYLRFHSTNFTYAADPNAHSPNMKNFTNDKFLVPEDAPYYPIVEDFDLHSMAYVSDTEGYAHTAAQGPWYAGPSYVNTAGKWIPGVYLDVTLADAQRFGGTGVDEIGYLSGFNDGEPSCLDNNSKQYRDGNYFYGGCFNHWGGSTRGIDPWR